MTEDPAARVVEVDRTLGSYWSFVRRHIALVLVGMLLGGALATVQIARSPVSYRTTVAVVSSLLPAAVNAPAVRRSVSLDSDAQVVRSTRVLADAASTVGFPGGYEGLSDALNITAVPNSRMLLLRVSAATPALARATASTVANRFIEVRRATIDRQLTEQRALLQQQIDAANAQLTLLRQDNLAAGDDTSLAVKERDLTLQLGELEQRLAASVAEEPDAGFIAQPAPLPRNGVRANVPGTLIAGTLLGLLIALLLAAFTDAWRPARRNRRGQRRRPVARPRQAAHPAGAS